MGDVKKAGVAPLADTWESWTQFLNCRQFALYFYFCVRTGPFVPTLFFVISLYSRACRTYTLATHTINKRLLIAHLLQHYFTLSEKFPCFMYHPRHLLCCRDYIIFQFCWRVSDLKCSTFCSIDAAWVFPQHNFFLIFIYLPVPSPSGKELNVHLIQLIYWQHNCYFIIPIIQMKAHNYIPWS